MRLLGWIFIILVFFSLAACQKTPDAVDSQGHPIYLSDYKDKWLVVNYWATWCTPCLAELPELNKLSVAHADKLAILGVSFDALTAIEIQKFSQSMHIVFPMLPNFPLQKFAITTIPSLPVTFLISPAGKFTNTLYGPQTQASLLTAMGIK